LNTERLIDLLASGAEPVAPRGLERRLSLTVLAGGTGAIVLLLAVYGLNPQLSSLLATGGFWVKMAFTGTLSVAALIAMLRLARPGEALGRAVWWAVAAFAVLWCIGATTLIDADSGARLTTVMGRTWRTCPFNIALLSLPTFVATAVALRSLAPTRLRAAGAAAGFFSGAVGAFIYGLHCPEMALRFRPRSARCSARACCVGNTARRIARSDGAPPTRL
jgi:hypothetical protein